MDEKEKHDNPKEEHLKYANKGLAFVSKSLREYLHKRKETASKMPSALRKFDKKLHKENIHTANKIRNSDIAKRLNDDPNALVK
jgi:hypothetical protein